MPSLAALEYAGAGYLAQKQQECQSLLAAETAKYRAGADDAGVGSGSSNEVEYQEESKNSWTAPLLPVAFVAAGAQPEEWQHTW